MTIWVQLQLQYQHGWPVGCPGKYLHYREMKKKHFLRILLRKEFKTLSDLITLQSSGSGRRDGPGWSDMLPPGLLFL